MGTKKRQRFGNRVCHARFSGTALFFIAAQTQSTSGCISLCVLCQGSSPLQHFQLIEACPHAIPHLYLLLFRTLRLFGFSFCGQSLNTVTLFFQLRLMLFFKTELYGLSPAALISSSAHHCFYSFRLETTSITVNSNGFAYFQALTARLSATYCSATLP